MCMGVHFSNNTDVYVYGCIIISQAILTYIYVYIYQIILTYLRMGVYLSDNTDVFVYRYIHFR